jgi:hypothetical protein
LRSKPSGFLDIVTDILKCEVMTEKLSPERLEKGRGRRQGGSSKRGIQNIRGY